MTNRSPGQFVSPDAFVPFGGHSVLVGGRAVGRVRILQRALRRMKVLRTEQDYTDYAASIELHLRDALECDGTDPWLDLQIDPRAFEVCNPGMELDLFRRWMLVHPRRPTFSVVTNVN